MTDRRRAEARVGAWAGIGFVVLGLMATFLYPQPPRLDSAPAAILRWAHEHRAGIAAGMILGVFAALLFIWFAVYLQRRLAGAGHDFLGSVVYGSGIAYAVFVALGSLPAATLVFMQGQRGGLTDGDVIRLLRDLYQILYAPATGLIGVLFLAVGAAAVDAGVFSRWLGWLTIVMGMLCLVETVPIMINSSYHPGGWAVMGWGTAVGSLLIPVILCVEILRRPLLPAPSGR
jgi:Domain of unknown function (DUF4386)